MAATISNASPQQQAVNLDNIRGRLIQLTFAATDYPTGGYAITPAAVGLNEIYAATPMGINNSVVTTTPTFQWNTSTGKLQAFGTAGSAGGLTEIAAATDLSALKVRLWVWGV